MADPANVINVKLLDPNYQTVATGTLSMSVDSNADSDTEPSAETGPHKQAVSGVLNLSGSFSVNNLQLTGSGNFYVLGNPTGMMMAQSFVLSGNSGDTPYYLMLTSWGDDTALLGYFFAEEGFSPGKRYIIAG